MGPKGIHYRQYSANSAPGRLRKPITFEKFSFKWLL